MIGCFRTVGTAVAEAEASLPTSKERHLRKGLSMRIDLHSMPGAYTLAKLTTRPAYRGFVSPMQKIAECAKGAALKELEAIRLDVPAP